MQQNAEYKIHFFVFLFFSSFYGFFFCFLIDIYNNSLLSECQPDSTVSWLSRTPRTPGLSDPRTPGPPGFFGPDWFLVL